MAKTPAEAFAERGLRDVLRAVAPMPDDGGWQPGDPPAHEPAAEPTIEERLLASDEPLRVLALPGIINGWAVFLGVQQVSDDLGYSEVANDWARRAESWRETVRAQRTADAAPERA